MTNANNSGVPGLILFLTLATAGIAAVCFLQKKREQKSGVHHQSIWITLPCTLVLVILAFTLPARISQFNDRYLLDRPHLASEETGEGGLTGSARLSLPEKLLLIKSGNYSSVSADEITGPILKEKGNSFQFTVTESNEVSLYDKKTDVNIAVNEAEEYGMEIDETWGDRLLDARGELVALQRAGGLPILWTDNRLTLIRASEEIYIDNDSQIAFSLYRMVLESDMCYIDLQADAQTGRLLSIGFQWSLGAPPSWGTNGANTFGDVWRSYWGMDSVNISWRENYIQNILVQTEEMTQSNSSSLAAVVFSYDRQTLEVPLYAQTLIKEQICVLQWNQVTVQQGNTHDKRMNEQATITYYNRSE